MSLRFLPSISPTTLRLIGGGAGAVYGIYRVNSLIKNQSITPQRGCIMVIPYTACHAYLSSVLPIFPASFVISNVFKRLYPAEFESGEKNNQMWDGSDLLEVMFVSVISTFFFSVEMNNH